MEFLKITSVDKVHYYALNTINSLCIKAFKNHLIHQDIALNSSYYKATNQATIDNIITNIRLSFFSDAEAVNTTYTTKEMIDTRSLNQIMNQAKNNKKI
jgi:hypothetical protein